MNVRINAISSKSFLFIFLLQFLLNVVQHYPLSRNISCLIFALESLLKRGLNDRSKTWLADLISSQPSQLLSSLHKLPRPRLQKCNRFILCAGLPVEEHKVFCEQIVAFPHQPHKDMKEMNAIKNNSIIGNICLQRLFKIERMFRPVHGLLFVVADMVAIVPTFHIISCVDAGNAVLIFITGVCRIDK